MSNAIYMICNEKKLPREPFLDFYGSAVCMT
jgi:hypothetical protein